MNKIDSLTLSYFTNKNQYENIKKKNDINNDLEFQKEKKFYRKRVLDLTKKLFRNEIKDNNLDNAFNNYVKICINYFKNLDETELIQNKYQDLNISNNINIDESIETNNYESYDHLLCNNIETKKINLDNYVIQTNKKNKKKVLPKKEDVNIKSKEYRTKGLKSKEKKKNISNIYEDKK